MLDVRAWLLWALTVLVAASSCRNPLYAVLLLLIVALTDVSFGPHKERRGLPSLFRFAALAVSLAAAFNALTVHFGETILFRLPGWLPLLGGRVTVEALVFGLINGLNLAVIFGGFSVFNRVTPVHDLARLAPQAFHEAGVVVSIALTFIPETNRSLNRIREAQAVRGHRVRGLRDWLPIVVPLLVSGLERSMGLAEAMVARGYGAVSDRSHPLRLQLLLAMGLLALLLGWLGWLFFTGWTGPALSVLAAGVCLVVGTVWLAGKDVPMTRYRSRRWRVRDTLVALGSGLTLAAVQLPIPVIGRDTLYYSPYPHLSMPTFHPLMGLLLLGLLVPAAVAIGGRSR